MKISQPVPPGTQRPSPEEEHLCPTVKITVDKTAEITRYAGKRTLPRSSFEPAPVSITTRPPVNPEDALIARVIARMGVASAPPQANEGD